MSEDGAPHVVLACSGLEHAHRGFESFARECFEALRDEPGVRIELVKGSGASAPGERAIPTLRRDNPVALALGRRLGTRPFRFEQVAFGLSLWPLLVRRRPDLVYLSEWDTARVLAALRPAAPGRRFRLLLSNGTMAAEGFDHLDHVQELSPPARDYVVARGADPSRHTALPLGFDIDRPFSAPAPAERSGLRERLGLPRDRRIVLSVAALNRYHKRLDYLIEEVARLSEPRPYLLLLGQPEPETPELRALARARLGEAGHAIRTVPAAEVPDFYRAVDAFVLASLWEGLPRALIEASAHGLPCLGHDYLLTEYALGPQGRRADFTEPGALAGLIASLEEADFDPQWAAARHAYAYEHFSWERLKPRYVALLREVAGYGTATSWPARGSSDRAMTGP